MSSCASCGADLPESARFCPACGTPVETPAAVEERKLATVLFADLVGSTSGADREDPERTRARLDRFYEAMAAEIEAAGGTVEKFAGDAVMAAFGVPAAQEDHAERALHAALAMQRRLRSAFGDELALRIGVNSGEVVVGRARERSSFVSGDVVNCAARLEQAAEPGEVLAGDRTAALGRGAFEFGDSRRVDAKGKGEGVVAVPVVRALSLMRPRGVSGMLRAFVGRDAEFELLLATYARAVQQRDPHLVTVMADAGVGKTRLVRELWVRLGEETPEPLRRTGRCLAYGDGITYWPLGEILKEHLGILESDPPDAVLARLDSRAILGLTLGLDVVGDLHPIAARDRLHEAWVELLGALAAERPVVLLVEDIHWAEEPLLELLERLVRDVRGPLLLICTARPELVDSRPSWGGAARNISSLWLKPLSAEDSVRMLDELLATPLPQALRDLVVARADGNPFFVEELIGTLIDRGVLNRRNGHWHAAELPAGFAIPDSVHAVVAARMDLLAPGQKAVLQAAAVAGRVFWEGSVAQLVDAEPDWQLLEQRDFIRRRTASAMEGEREYAFKHALTREVAYASLPKSRRAQLHAGFGEWLERSGGGRDEHAPLLAHHYAEAVRQEDADLAWADKPDELSRLRAKAVESLRRAGELALARYELDEAIALLTRAVELETDEAHAAELWRLLGKANALKFDGPAFWSAMERSIELSPDAAAQGAAFAELAYETSQRAGMWLRAPDRTLVESWVRKALDLSRPRSPEYVKGLLAHVFWDSTGAPEAAIEASVLAEELGDATLRTVARRARSIVASLAGDYNSAAAWAERSFELLPEITDPEQAIEAYELMVPASAALGRFKEARRLARIHDELEAKLTPHHRLHGVAMLAEVEELAGGWDQLAELEPRIEQTVRENQDTPCIRNARSLLLLALAHTYAGRHAQARRFETEADAFGAEGYARVLNPVRARIALARGEVPDVDFGGPTRRHAYWFGLAAASAALDLATARRDQDEVERLAADVPQGNRYLRPFAWRSLGAVRGDDALMRRAIDEFEAMSLSWHAGETRALSAS